MLINLDESLLHQSALPFQYADTSDHRFFDRYIVSTFSPSGDHAIVTGMGVYKNMNVTDGYAAYRHKNMQKNYRYSRQWRPDCDDAAVGPVRMEILKPFERVRYVCESGKDDAFDIIFESIAPPHLEGHHQGRLDGRQHTNYWRWSQHGCTNGAARFGGKDIQITDWFSWRDHSWGVRPAVGGFEPSTGGDIGSGPPSINIRSGGLGMIILFVGFSTPTVHGMVQVQEDETGRRFYVDGAVGLRNEEGVAVKDISFDLDFHPGTRLVREVTADIVTADDKTWHLEGEAVGWPWVFRGLGYDKGYSDGKGFGIHRGAGLHAEHDIFDLTSGERIRMPDGSWAEPRHRENPLRVNVNGEEGFAHSMVMPLGRFPKYGFEA